MSANSDRGGVAILADPFRPFFLGAALFALIAIPLWLWVYLAGPDLFSAAVDPRAWHIHEMLFGYLAAVLAGFLFTAIPNWTGRLPLHGTGLALLVLLWIAGRVVMAIMPAAWWAAVIDCAFLVAIALLAWREILAGRNWRNAPICFLVSLFAAANILMHIPATTAWGERLGLAVAAVLIGLVGGRITPSFTRNWLAKRETSVLPTPFGAYDKICLLALVAAFVVWIVAPDTWVAGALLVIAAAGHAVRLARWRPWLVVREPLLIVLHVGYGWLVLSLMLMGAASLGLAGIEPTSALHALAVGAVGTMTLGVMARATLGHTGGALTADTASTVMFAAISVAALLRVAAPQLPAAYEAAIIGSGLAWCLAFGLFVIRFGPILVTPRPRTTH